MSRKTESVLFRALLWIPLIVYQVFKLYSILCNCSEVSFSYDWAKEVSWSCPWAYKSLSCVTEHRSLLELSLSIDKSLSCVIEQLVIRHYILVELSLEVQGEQDYFRFVEGTCIIACVLSFSVLLLLSAALRFWTQVRLRTISNSESGNSFSERKKEKFLKTQLNPPPPLLWFFSPSVGIRA